MNNLGTKEQGKKVYEKLARIMKSTSSDLIVKLPHPDFLDLQAYIRHTTPTEVIGKRYTSRKIQLTVFISAVKREVVIIWREANKGASWGVRFDGGNKGFNPDILAGQFAFTAESLQLSGNNVTSWGDSLGGNALPVTGSPQYFATGGPNNLPYVKLSGGSTFTQSTGLSLTGTPADIFVVMRTPVITGNGLLVSVGSNSGTNGLRYTTNTNVRESYVYSGLPPYYLAESTGLVPRTTWMLIRIKWVDEDTVSVEINDEAYYFEGFATNGVSAAAYAFSFFQLAYADAEITEVRLFNNVLSDADANNMKAYFVNKYAIARPTKRIIICGDSHTVGIQSGTPIVAPYVNSFITNTAYTVTRYAANGTCAVNLNGPLNIQFVGFADKLTQFADSGYYVVINYGTNDCATANPGYGWSSWSQWKADFKAKVQVLITAGFDPNKIIMVTPPYSTGSYVNGQLGTVKTLITEIKNELGTNFIDWYQLMLDAGLDAATLPGGDGIHVNDTCHNLMYNALIAITGV